MSAVFDTSPLVTGLLSGQNGHGVLAENIPSTGTHGAAYTYNDLSLPADNGKEIRGLITVPPSGPNVVSFFAYEDTSFVLVVSADGVYTFDYELFVDGVSAGEETATVQIGGIEYTLTGSVTLSVNPTASSLTFNTQETITGDVTVSSSVDGAMLEGRVLAGDVAVAISPVASDLTFNSGYAIVGAVSVAVAVSAALAEGRVLQGDVSVGSTVAAGMALNGDYVLSGGVAVAADPTANGMVFNDHSELAGEVVLTTTVGAGLEFSDETILTGSVTVTAVVAAELDVDSIHELVGAVGSSVGVNAGMLYSMFGTATGGLLAIMRTYPALSGNVRIN